MIVDKDVKLNFHHLICYSVDFPYLVMLMSGGHCLLAVVEDVTEFKLLGTCLDTSPGDMLDKVFACIA